MMKAIKLMIIVFIIQSQLYGALQMVDKSQDS